MFQYIKNEYVQLRRINEWFAIMCVTHADNGYYIEYKTCKCIAVVTLKF